MPASIETSAVPTPICLVPFLMSSTFEWKLTAGALPPAGCSCGPPGHAVSVLCALSEMQACVDEDDDALVGDEAADAADAAGAAAAVAGGSAWAVPTLRTSARAGTRATVNANLERTRFIPLPPALRRDRLAVETELVTPVLAVERPDD